MWQKRESKLELAASMVRQVMPEFSSNKNVVILCDSWYAKKDLVRIVDEYPNLDVICNARCDSVIYDLAPDPIGRRGSPAKHGRRLSVQDDFALSDEKIGDYYTCVRRVLTNIFGKREVLAYVTSGGKTSGSRRRFFSTVFPEQLDVFCAWQEKAPLNQTGSSRMQYIPLLLYAFRWNIENDLNVFNYLDYLLKSLPNIDFANHPELLDEYLPCSEQLPAECRLTVNIKKQLKQ